jgi:hypothetical protein
MLNPEPGPNLPCRRNRRALATGTRPKTECEYRVHCIPIVRFLGHSASL